MFDTLTNDNILIYAIKSYEGLNYIQSEFKEDYRLFKYVKRLLQRYRNGGELRVNLVLNHLNMIYNTFGIEAGTLFLIQFFWQFPHFWAIGWFLYEDYEKAGFFMLPSGKKDNSTALQIILYTLWLIIASLLPVFGYTGQFFITKITAVGVLLLGLWMLFYAVKLYQTRTAKSARTLMLVSVSYITLLQLVYILDKFLR